MYINSIEYYLVKKNHVLLIFIFLFVLFVVFNIILILPKMLSRNQSYEIATQAQTDLNFCQDKCIGQDRCGPNGPPGDPNYNAPCCEKVKETGDPHACDWPQRGYCTDDQCAGIPEGVSRERCGGPRHSWCNMCRDAKCPGYVDNPTPTPTESLAPTTEPEATEPPARPTEPQTQPTTILRIPPNKPRPTINAFPTAEPITSSPQFEFPSIHLPTFNLPKTQINLPKINQLVQKPLNLFEYLFKRIVYYDRFIENIINEQIKRIVPK